MNTHDIIISAEQLETCLATPDNIVLVDLQSAEHYANAHIPGAVHLDYSKLVISNGSAAGLLPSAASVSKTLQTLGIDNNSHVVAYDSEGGAAASRLIWTLHVFGHYSASLLDGGLHNWVAQQKALQQDINVPQKTGNFVAGTTNHALISIDELLPRINDPSLTVLDARSLEEYQGIKILAARGGHIPSAKHIEWVEMLDRDNHLQLKPDQALQQMLNDRGIDKNDEIVVHCQTHRRSSLSYVVLKHLGYGSVRGYHGSWSEWGNRSDTPVAR